MSELTPRQKAAAQRIAERERLRRENMVVSVDPASGDGESVVVEDAQRVPPLDAAELKLRAVEVRHAELLDQIRAKEAEFQTFQTRMEEISADFERRRAEKETELTDMLRKSQEVLDEVDRKTATRLTDEPAHPYASSPEDLFRQFLGTTEGIYVTDPRVPSDKGALMGVLDHNAKTAFLAGVKMGRGA